MLISPIKALFNLIPDPDLASQLWWEARTAVRRHMHEYSSRKKFKGVNRILANVGCGAGPKPDWVNLDLQATPGITWWDCRRGLPFEASSVSMIFSEHMYEHLNRPRSTQVFLADCLRCLEPGGVLRLVVPDAGMYLDAYASREWDTLITKRPLLPKNGVYKDFWLHHDYRTRMELVNEVFRQGVEHKYAYDAETLMMDLREAGFLSVIQQEFGKTASPHAVIDSPDRASESLYVEGVKQS
jgi:predicted SAM-dependent methyltransferase